MDSPFTTSPLNDVPDGDYSVRSQSYLMCTLEDGLSAWDRVLERTHVVAPKVKTVEGNLGSQSEDDTRYRLASYLSEQFSDVPSVAIVGSQVAVSSVLMSKITQRIKIVTNDPEVPNYVVSRLKGITDFSISVVPEITEIPPANLIVTDQVESVAHLYGKRRVVGVGWAAGLISHFEPPFFLGRTECGNAALTFSKTIYAKPDIALRKVPLVHATSESRVGRRHSKGPCVFRWLYDSVPTVALDKFDPKNYFPVLTKMPVAYASLPVRRIFAKIDKGDLSVVCFRSDTYFGVLDDGVLEESGSHGDSDLIVYWAAKHDPRKINVVLDYFKDGAHVNYNFSELQVLSTLEWSPTPPGGLYVAGNCDEMYSHDLFGLTYIDEFNALGKNHYSCATHEMVKATLKYNNTVRPKLFQMSGIDRMSDKIKLLRERIQYEEE